MKVIFLDCDGVLNSEVTKERVGPYVGLDPYNVQNFNKIVDAVPEAKIVISSTWRASSIPGFYNDVPSLIELWKSLGIKGDFIDITPISWSYEKRGNEIRNWIEDYNLKNPGVLESFVILDDLEEGMEGFRGEVWVDRIAGEDIYKQINKLDLRPFHVVTDWIKDLNSGKGGLQEKDAELAITILNEGKLSDLL